MSAHLEVTTTSSSLMAELGQLSFHWKTTGLATGLNVRNMVSFGCTHYRTRKNLMFTNTEVSDGTEVYSEEEEEEQKKRVGRREGATTTTSGGLLNLNVWYPSITPKIKDGATTRQALPLSFLLTEPLLFSDLGLLGTSGALPWAWEMIAE